MFLSKHIFSFQYIQNCQPKLLIPNMNWKNGQNKLGLYVSKLFAFLFTFSLFLVIHIVKYQFFFLIIVVVFQISLLSIFLTSLPLWLMLFHHHRCRRRFEYLCGF